MVICLERGADLHMAQLMPLPLTVFCFSKIQVGFSTDRKRKKVATVMVARYHIAAPAEINPSQWLFVSVQYFVVETGMTFSSECFIKICIEKTSTVKRVNI